MAVLDSHVHIASPDRERYPVSPTGIGSPWWHGDNSSVEALLEHMALAAVDGIVITQAVGPYGFDNRYILDSVADHPERLTAVVAVDLDAEAAEDDLIRLAAVPSVTGVRFFAMTSARRWVGTDRAARAMAVAADHGLTVVLTVPMDDLQVLRSAITEATAAIVIDHCGFPEYESGRIRWDQPVLDFATSRHVRLKVTTHSFNGAGHQGRQLIEQLAELFGPSRLLWGSDFPQTEGDYGKTVDLGRLASEELDTESRKAFLGGNTALLFGPPSWGSGENTSGGVSPTVGSDATRLQPR
jgi:L-fuconolactonase